MKFGEKPLQRGDKGTDIEELQLHLAGFRGTVWDGDFGPGTELQVMTFQKDYMNMETPTGIVNDDTFAALDQFEQKFSIDFEAIKCSCGVCDGFGQNRFKNKYQAGKSNIEAFYRYEYPGIHKAILNSFKAAQFYASQAGYDIPYPTSGYRCWVNNEQKNRQSTNHMGKALDIDFPLKPNEDKQDDCNRCNAVRGLLVEKCGFQIAAGGAGNMKALEPADIAPTWIHMDVRCYSRKYLHDKYFIKNNQELDGHL